MTGRDVRKPGHRARTVRNVQFAATTRPPRSISSRRLACAELIDPAARQVIHFLATPVDHLPLTWKIGVPEDQLGRLQKALEVMTISHRRPASMNHLLDVLLHPCM